MVMDQPPSLGRKVNGAAYHGPPLVEDSAVERRFTLLEVAIEDHARRLERLEAAPSPSSSRKNSGGSEFPASTVKSPPGGTLVRLAVSQAAQCAGQWVGGLLALAYVMRGGDLMTALQALAKLF